MLAGGRAGIDVLTVPEGFGVVVNLLAEGGFPSVIGGTFCLGGTTGFRTGGVAATADDSVLALDPGLLAATSVLISPLVHI